jgi:hypothetical protein
LGQDDGRMSVAVIVIILVVVIPVAVIMTGAIAAAILGWLAKSDVEERYEGTEYIDMGA